MPSSHAANCFGQAMLFGLIYVRVRWELFTFAFLVSISRIFVGVHYPGDVLVGILVGSVIGVAVVVAWWQLPVSLSHHLATDHKNTPRQESGGFKP
jgi:membrane-associated phospholipid phosphatase